MIFCAYISEKNINKENLAGAEERGAKMDTILIQSLSLVEESESSDSPETTGSLLVPDPDSEYGYTVEEMPETYGTILTEEEFAEKFGSYQAINNVALSNYLPFLLPFTASICLAYLLNRFLQPRLNRFQWVNHLLSVALFFTLFMWRWWIRLPRGLYYLFPIMEMILLLAGIFLIYRGKCSKKIYAGVTFEAVFGLCQALYTYGQLFFKELGSYLDLPQNSEIFRLYSYMKDSSSSAHASETINIYFDWEKCLMLFLACMVLILSVRKLVRMGKRDTEGIPRSELYFLLMPSFAAVVYSIFTGAAYFLVSNSVFVDWATWDDPLQSMTLYFMMPFLAVASLLCILYAYGIYQKLVSYVEEKQRAVILENQVNQMQGHIKEIEELYTGIRSMRHDMQNCLFDIKSLLAAQGIDVEENGSELAGYFSGIGNALDTLKFSIHTGNPVTDVVINGKARRAKDRGIQFDSEFRFPKDYGIDAFDLSIILNNSLDNALEACELLQEKDSEAKAYIKIRSYCKNNMFLMEMENSCDGLVIETGNGTALQTRKGDAVQHGLGYQNILRCAEKYFGGADYRCSGQTFQLTVMLQKNLTS